MSKCIYPPILPDTASPLICSASHVTFQYVFISTPLKNNLDNPSKIITSASYFEEVHPLTYYADDGVFRAAQCGLHCREVLPRAEIANLASSSVLLDTVIIHYCINYPWSTHIFNNYNLKKCFHYRKMTFLYWQSQLYLLLIHKTYNTRVIKGSPHIK